MNKLPKPVKLVLLILSIIAAIIIILSLLNLSPWAPGYGSVNPMRLKEGESVHIVPHGGAKLLYPENTVYSFQMMHTRGWDTFEVDLTLTKDGVLISHHDLSIERTTGIPGEKVQDLNYSDLKKFNFGKNFISLEGDRPYADNKNLAPGLLEKLVPARLEDLFAEYPNTFYILELKDKVETSGQATAEKAVEELVRLVKTYKMQDKVVIASFDDKLTKAFRDLTDNAIPTAAATGESLVLSVLSAVHLDFFLKPQYAAVMLPIKDQIYPSERALIEKLPAFLRNALSTYDPETDTMYTNLANKRMVRDSHRKNLAVYYWTVNDPAEMRRLIELGVDGIITDRPDILQEVIKESN